MKRARHCAAIDRFAAILAQRPSDAILANAPDDGAAPPDAPSETSLLRQRLELDAAHAAEKRLQVCCFQLRVAAEIVIRFRIRTEDSKAFGDNPARQLRRRIIQ